MVLFLHNRYRTTGGEERVVEDLLALVREQLGEDAELLARDSAALGRRHGRGAGCCAAGSTSGRSRAAVRRSGARVVHAHNLLPGFGWRALAAARAAGARVVLHLHQYRLVCAVGVCFTRRRGVHSLPRRATRCPGSRATAAAAVPRRSPTAPRSRSGSGALTRWPTPSSCPARSPRERLRELGAPLPRGACTCCAPPVAPAGAATPGAGRGGRRAAALRAGRLRLAPEKGVDVAIDACRLAGIPLVVAGEGPSARALARARGAAPTCASQGRVERERAGARCGPARRSRSCPRARPRRSGSPPPRRWRPALPGRGEPRRALPELRRAADALVAPGDARAPWPRRSGGCAGDREAGERGRGACRASCARRSVVAAGLRGDLRRGGARDGPRRSP